jgi:hypothetical protein
MSPASPTSPRPRSASLSSSLRPGKWSAVQPTAHAAAAGSARESVEAESASLRRSGRVWRGPTDHLFEL